MERMDMHSKNEYLKVIRERYFPARTRKEKTLLLDEYCGNTRQIESQNATTRLTFCQHTCPEILCGVGPEQCETVSFRSQ
jgi:hypothetical protein